MSFICKEDASLGGVAGSIQLDRTGIIWRSFVEQSDSDNVKKACGTCSPCMPIPTQVEVAAHNLVGAIAEADGALRIWYCDRVKSLAPGGTDKIQYKLKKTER